jgi:hypothetical protein
MIFPISQLPQTKQHVMAPPPRWDAAFRVLRVGNKVVKEYRLPSRNQETILEAFQEEGWPHSIDDPLPPLAEVEPKSRLHDTIKRLNRHHKDRLIRFRGDGTGEGICWEYVEAANLPLPQDELQTRRAA